ncbi:hypothetical protein ElyMa_003203100 [Elysia marginata]|uniref:Alpha-macroglobulin-like TED domain-containing protein n=1 Tax=Elysia marginata TaxID=1093978 RepID=A0AAV4J3J6_9GAST|nr:hypothetical protein ElyMa_003203100 [Elysia marginata]
MQSPIEDLNIISKSVGHRIHCEKPKQTSKQASELALTSYVLISILEAPKSYRARIQSVIDRAVQFVMASLDITDLGQSKRTMAFVAYAISLTRLDENKRTLVEKLVYATYGIVPILA